MKKLFTILILLSAIALAQDEAPTLIVIPQPRSVEVKQPVSLTLTPEQVQGLVKALASAGVALPQGVTNINLNVITTGSNAGGIQATLRFH